MAVVCVAIDAFTIARAKEHQPSAKLFLGGSVSSSAGVHNVCIRQSVAKWMRTFKLRSIEHNPAGLIWSVESERGKTGAGLELKFSPAPQVQVFLHDLRR